eukprot:CAMPEP_0179337898 /NCGR_PEP_ID=MMETSP0797-20121207/67888_1 /TAXON_ID=47934 /ORGANISM="Dinophysis acuminata, Strain DAEP01" /LENGTH=111 /DNA_ID=CAMNT_0021051615 /DNA_START=243 /DNA_END=578 /DNA_ORIENTATION=+
MQKRAVLKTSAAAAHTVRAMCRGWKSCAILRIEAADSAARSGACGNFSPDNDHGGVRQAQRRELRDTPKRLRRYRMQQRAGAEPEDGQRPRRGRNARDFEKKWRVRDLPGG